MTLFDSDYTMFYMVAGIIIMTASLLLHQFKRRRLELERQARQRAAVEAIRETERKQQQFQTGKTVKTKPEKTSSAIPERIPLPDLPNQQFTGAYSPRNIAKWEVEIHQIGRQMIGTLDSKMVALQTLTQEANRAANRIELLLERFEELVKPQFNPINQNNQSNQNNQNSQNNQNDPNNRIGQNSRIDQKFPQNNEFQQSPISKENLTSTLPENLPNLIPAGTAELPATSLVLNNLQPDQTQQPNSTETLDPIPRATILKAEEIKEKNKSEKRSHSAELLGEPLPSTISLSITNPRQHRSSIESPEIGKGTKSPYYEKPTSSPEIANNSLRHNVTGTGSRMKPLQKPENQSFGSLYDDKLAEREHEEVFAVAAPSRSNSPPTSASRLDLQKQIEMLDNYGYSPRQIAQSLNMTVGEVDLLLKLKGEK
ncbi:MAG: hypothetical protein LBG58_11305 [Planctomycetaceae bacterium]|jgi:hypothetical protein|nr:hypothetical protein [Planctomycetaceae bacterium]